MKIKVCTWNVSEGIETTCDLNNLVEKDVENSELLKSITKVINENDFDVVCFQEYPTEKEGKDLTTNEIVNNTELKNYILHHTCPSYLFKGGKVGVAIFSKYPLNNVKKLFFVNPNLSHTSSRTGKTFYSFDKGIISADIEVENKSFHLVTGHAIAFAPFGCTEKDYPESYIPLEKEIINNYKNNLIVMGDFNTEDLESLIPNIKDKVKETITYDTTYDYYENRGPLKVDYILIGEGLICNGSYRIESLSDHYACVSEIEKK